MSAREDFAVQPFARVDGEETGAGTPLTTSPWTPANNVTRDASEVGLSPEEPGDYHAGGREIRFDPGRRSPTVPGRTLPPSVPARLPCRRPDR
jgi:hypothetical protein